MCIGNCHTDVGVGRKYTHLGTFFLQHKHAASIVINDMLTNDEIKYIKKSSLSIISKIRSTNYRFYFTSA